MILKPIIIKQANAFIAEHHRHNKPVVGARFCLGCYSDEELVGVCVVGRPVARGFDEQCTAEVTRLCVKDDAPENACSFLYSAAKRVWQTMGGKRLITYTLKKESGSSLKGAGWVFSTEVKVHNNPWNSANRIREVQDVFNEPKIRWHAPI